MKKAQVFGLALIVLVIAGAFVWKAMNKNEGSGTFASVATQPVQDRTPVIVKGPIGGEKVGFTSDPVIQEKMRSKFGITVEAKKKGSIAMVEESADGQDFIWPSSPTALEIYKARNGKMLKSETIFNSPLVFYSWDVVCEALIKQGVVSKVGEAYYVVDMPKFTKLVIDGKQWKDIGLSDLYGGVSILTTDPTKSMSGNLFSGLLANMMNGGRVVSDATLGSVLPKLAKFFGELGYMESSSGDLFAQFLKQGLGSYPVIVGYENQMIEFSIQNEQYINLLRQRVRTLYPKPTVWASHPFIAITPNGARLLEALQDQEIQQLAWERHGFRSGMMGVQNSTKVLKVIGVPETIDSVIAMPSFTVMQDIITKLETKTR
jgi:hypothetical protein